MLNKHYNDSFNNYFATTCLTILRYKLSIQVLSLLGIESAFKNRQVKTCLCGTFGISDMFSMKGGVLRNIYSKINQ